MAANGGGNPPATRDPRLLNSAASRAPANSTTPRSPAPSTGSRSHANSLDPRRRANSNASHPLATPTEPRPPASSIDPRRQANSNDQRLRQNSTGTTSQAPQNGQTQQLPDDPSRKRIASQSPAGIDKPLQKIARPSHMSGGYVNSSSDPRLASSGTSRAIPAMGTISHAPNGSTGNDAIDSRNAAPGNGPASSTMRTASPASNGIAGSRRGSVQQSNLGGVSDGGTSSGASTPQAPVAQMVSSSTGVSLAQTLLEVNRAAMDASESRLRLSQLEPAAAKANSDYEAMKPHFDFFPAIRETQTNTKKAAEARLADERNKLTSLHAKEMAASHALGRTLSAMMSQAMATDPNAAARLDAMDSKFDALNGRIGKMGETVTSMASDLKMLKGEVASNQSKLDKSKVTTTHTDARIAKLEKDVLELNRSDHGNNNLGSMISKVDTLETTLAAFGNDIQVLKSSVGTQSSIDGSQLSAIAEEVQTLKENQEGAHEVLGRHVDTELEQHRQNAAQWVQDKISEAQQSFQAAQSQTVQTISDCVNEISKLRGYIERAATKEALEETRKMLSNVTDALEKLQSQPPQNSGEPEEKEDPLASMQFKPLAPPGTEPTEAELSRIEYMEQSIEALKGTVLLHAQQYNNLTTDTVVAQMVDQMSVIYPHAKDFQGTVQKINQGMLQISNNSNSMIARINTLEADKGVRAEVADLKSKVEKHEEAMARGQTAFTDLSTEIKTIKAKQLETQGALEEACDRIAERNVTSG